MGLPILTVGRMKEHHGAVATGFRGTSVRHVHLRGTWSPDHPAREPDGVLRRRRLDGIAGPFVTDSIALYGSLAPIHHLSDTHAAPLARDRLYIKEIPMGRPTRLLPFLVVLLLIRAWPADAQNPDDSPGRAAAAAGAVASSFAPDGVPQFLLATADLVGPAGAQPGDLARWHLARFSRAYRVSAEDLAAAEIVDVQTVRTGR